MVPEVISMLNDGRMIELGNDEIGYEDVFAESRGSNQTYAQFKLRLGEGSRAVHYEVEKNDRGCVIVGLHVGPDTDARIRSELEEMLKCHVPKNFFPKEHNGEFKIITWPQSGKEKDFDSVKDDLCALYIEYEPILHEFEQRLASM